MKLQQSIPDWIGEFVGWQYKDGGVDRDGADCFGLVRAAFLSQFRLVLPWRLGTTTSIDGGELWRSVDDEIASGAWVRVGDRPERVGDVGVFAVAGRPHVGMAVSVSEMLHVVDNNARSCVERFDSGLWRNRCRGWYRYEPSVAVVATKIDPTQPKAIEVRPGATMLELAEAAGVLGRRHIRGRIDDFEVPEAMWRCVRPKPGRVVTFFEPAAGGGEGGKQVARVVATLAIAAAAIYTGGAAAAAMGFAQGTTAFAVAAGTVTAATTIAGTLAVQALVPMRGSRLSENGLGDKTSPSITGAGNTTRPYGVMNCPIGHIRVVPPLAAQPYTENVGSDQYLRMLFDVGYGRLALSDFMIGKTPIEQYEGVEIEVREGYEGEGPIRLFPGQILQENVGVLLEPGVNQQRTSATGVNELMVDFTLPRGVANVSSSGALSERTVAVVVEYRAVGATDWIAVANQSPTSERALSLLFRGPESRAVGDGQWNDAAWWGWSGAPAVPAGLPAAEWGWEAYGYFRFEESGEWVFAVDADGPVEVEVAGQIVASWYGEHGSAGGAAPSWAHSGTVNLRGYTAGIASIGGGVAPIRIRCGGSGAPGKIAVAARAPSGGSLEVIPAASLRVAASRSSQQGLRTRAWDWSGRAGEQVFRASSTALIRRTVAWGVEPGQYEVRVRRVTAAAESGAAVDDVYWSAIKGARPGAAVKAKNRAMIALRIKATDQLSGVIDNFSCMARLVAPVWDEASERWVNEQTNNPASLILWVLQGPACSAPMENDRVDFTKFAAFWVRCRDRGFECNAVIDFEGTQWARMNDIAACGRASMTVEDDKFSVVIDEPQTVPRMVITPRNSTEASGRLLFPDPPHALRCRFMNEANGYEPDEQFVYADGYNADGSGGKQVATRFEPMEYFGETKWENVYRRGRYDLATAALRPETLTRKVDTEHFTAKRGNLVLVHDEVMGIGQMAARILSVIEDAGDVVGVDLDAQVLMNATGSYSLVVRLASTSVWRAVVTNDAGGPTNRVYFANRYPSSGVVPEVGDLCVFGETGLEVRAMVVQSIVPDSDMTAVVTLVDHAPEVHDADVGEIPDYDPGITRDPVYVIAPPAPVVLAIRSDDFVAIIGQDGSLVLRMVVSLAAPDGGRVAADFYQVRYRRKAAAGQAPGAFVVLPAVDASDGSVAIAGVQQGVRYELAVRSISRGGRASAWVNRWTPVAPDPEADGDEKALEHTVVGRTRKPPDVLSFDVSRGGDGTRIFEWALPEMPPDFVGVSIRYTRGGVVVPEWQDATLLRDGVIEEASPWEANEPAAGDWWFGIKAVDSSGNESTNAVWVRRRLGPARQDGVVFSHDAVEEGWPWSITDAYVSNDGYLWGRGQAAWDELPATWDAWTTWTIAPVTAIAYESPAIDIGAIVDIQADAVVQAVSGDVAVSVKYSQDGVTWSAWQELSRRTLAGRYFKFRATLEVGAGTIPVLTSALFSLRAEAIVHHIEDLYTVSLDPVYRVAAGDVRLPVPAELFGVIRGVAVTFNGAGAGWTWELVDRSPVLGPRVRLYNGSSVMSDARIDATIRGIRAAQDYDPLVPGGIVLPDGPEQTGELEHAIVLW